MALHDALSLQCVDACMKLDSIAMRQLVAAWQHYHMTYLANGCQAVGSTPVLLPRTVATELLERLLPVLIEQSAVRLAQRAEMHRQRLADMKDCGLTPTTVMTTIDSCRHHHQTYSLFDRQLSMLSLEDTQRPVLAHSST